MKVIIIAEAGVNHNGELSIARKLIFEAANAGADYIKFQTFSAKKLVSITAEKAEYQKKNTGDANSNQFQMLSKLELPLEWHFELKDYANSLGIKFLSTGFDEESVDFLDSLDIELFKIPSGEITNKPYLQHIAKKGKPIILSTGMCEVEEISEAIDVLLNNGVMANSISLLHCNTEYPTPMIDVNLKAMNYLGSLFNFDVGYSDHTLGIEVPIAAVALGATIIEKHFTLDKELEGPDHKASLDPFELNSMIKAIRNIELAISGDGIKKPSNSEKKNIIIARKSIHFKNSLSKGAIIGEDDLIMLRPGDGISPMLINEVVGKVLNKNISSGDKLKYSDIEL